MKAIRYFQLTSYIVMACLFATFIACESAPQSNESSRSELATDTVFVDTAVALTEALRSNRVIKLSAKEYLLFRPLPIHKMNHLTIVGTNGTYMMLYGEKSTVIELQNASTISLDSLTIGFKESTSSKAMHGTINISDSEDIKLTNIKLYGGAGIALNTLRVKGLEVSNSSMSYSSQFIFELQQTKHGRFTNTTFNNNHLSVSILGAFTQDTSDILFSDCRFIDNSPKQPGNPAFNFFENNKNFEDKVIFRDCEFRNNKGFKWYNDKITLENCKVDTTDFVNAMDL